MILLNCACVACILLKFDNPHAPRSLTWQVFDTNAGEIISSAQTIAPAGTWWPELGFCFRTINPTARSYPPNLIRSYGFYACPGATKYRNCGRPDEFFCRSWSCVTSNDGDWKWSVDSTDGITFSFANPGPGPHVTIPLYAGKPCYPRDYVRVQFTEKGKQTPLTTWLNGLSWGLVYYRYGSKPGSLLSIRLKIESSPPVPIGPDKVLSEQGPPGPQKLTSQPLPPLTKTTHPPQSTVPSLTQLPTTGDRLFNLIQGAFQALNATNPNATTSCWLCLAVGPPYYEGIAITGPTLTTADPNLCPWESKSKLTLTEVSGSGLCLGKVPQTQQHLCNSSMTVTGTNQYLIPSNTSWWACSTGLTPCVSTSVFDQSKDFCIMIQLVPRIYYHSEEIVLEAYDFGPKRIKREPVSLTLAVMLGIGLAAGVGTGTTALITGPQQLQHRLDTLHAAMAQDIKALESSVSKLEESLTSLSEVVLQNRRGLDLLFLKEGGLCAALKEECCFYVDHSGAIRDSMNKLRERLEKRQRDQEVPTGTRVGSANRHG